MEERTRIVLIDNDADDLVALEHAIQELVPGALCISFIFADEAVRMIRDEWKYSPDYIFIDVHMSRLSGRECLTELRSLERLRKCRIFMFSGVMPAAVGEAFKKLGAAGYYQKPFSETAYRQTLEPLLAPRTAPV